MNENFLHFIWKFKRFDQFNLRTTEGETLEIIHPGFHNTNSGPDFFNAKIKINDTLWVGNVEIHVLGSDWYRHNHQVDRSYDNVILHVVYKNDKDVIVNESPLSTLEMSDLLESNLIENYEQLMGSKQWVPCENLIASIPNVFLTNLEDKLIIDRLNRKSENIIQLYHQSKKNWSDTLYQTLAANFGFKTNELPFRILARNTPIKLLGKFRNELLYLEALLFGQAGLLERDFNEEYPNCLKRIYWEIKVENKLRSIEAHIWKFFRLRPYNFPSVRIAQFAALVHQSSNLFSKIIRSNSVVNIKDNFRVVTSPYWLDHYNFDKKSKPIPKKIGENSIDNILINSVVPIIYGYGVVSGNYSYREMSIEILENIRSEQNGIIRKWNEVGLKINSAMQSQAWIEQKNRYCFNKKCLNCSIGNFILRK